MTNIPTKLFIGCLIIWSTYVMLFPTWKAYGHSQEVGLVRQHAPIWFPPSPDSSSNSSSFWTWTGNSVRWPFFPKPTDRPSYVEIALGRTVVRWTIGVMLLGSIFRIASQVFRSKPRDGIISAGWSVTIGLGLAWIVLLVVPVFSSVLEDAPETMSVGILMSGAIVGLVYGIWRNYRGGKRSERHWKKSESSPTSLRVALMGRSKIILVSRLIGGISLLAAGGATLLAGLGLDLAIAKFLLAASVAVFACVEVDRWKPGWGGISLCGLAFILDFTACYISIHKTFGFDVYVGGLISLCLGVPLFAIGTLLFFSAQRPRSWLDQVWWYLFVMAIGVGGLFIFFTSGSIETIMHQSWLKRLQL